LKRLKKTNPRILSKPTVFFFFFYPRGLPQQSLKRLKLEALEGAPREIPDFAYMCLLRY